MLDHVVRKNQVKGPVCPGAELFDPASKTPIEQVDGKPWELIYKLADRVAARLTRELK